MKATHKRVVAHPTPTRGKKPSIEIKLDEKGDLDIHLSGARKKFGTFLKWIIAFATLGEGFVVVRHMLL